ncbi:MAG: helix-turn-helix transcriptional regulator [Chitinophagaceae bacterium]|nr:helix-turn-helix transcriptional regulator [Chitinophagaceae bacterium]
MSGQLSIFLLLFGGLQGILLVLFLIRRKFYRGGYIFLLLYFGIMLLQVTLKVMSKAWLWENWSIMYRLSYYLPLLYGPLIYLFVRQLLLNKRVRAFDLLHFVPFVILFANLVVQRIYAPSWDWAGLLDRSDSGLTLQLVSLAIYHYIAWQHWQLHRDRLKDRFSDTERLQVNWIRKFIVTSYIACSIVSMAIFLLYMTYPRGMEYRFAFASLTLFIYWVSYTALTTPSVFSVIKGFSLRDNPARVLPALVVHRPTKKYSNSGLAQEEVSTIKSTIQSIMDEKKPYLDPALTINDLAALARCNRHHLSQVLNESIQRSFYDYVNYYRVEEAKLLLHDPSRASHKIASIAYDAGFNSLSTFNEVFRKTTGQTPSQYRKGGMKDSQRQRV